jgi:hypothetical protein
MTRPYFQPNEEFWPTPSLKKAMEKELTRRLFLENNAKQP